MNFLQISFTILTFLFAILGGLFTLCKHNLPDLLRQGFCYGKMSGKGQNPLIRKLEIPKRCFQHFYIFGVTLSVSVLFLSVTKFFYSRRIPEFVFFILDLWIGRDRKPSVPLVNTLLALFLFTIHLFKRLFETHKVNVFSDAKMNVGHYILAFMHYFSCIVVMIGESEGFVKGSEVNFQNSLKIKDWFGAIIFLWMTYQQLESNIILSNLRKDKEGVVVTKEYKLPQKGLFDNISAPLQFTEIGVYGGLQIILWQNTTFKFIVLWVVTNQFTYALICHQWYIKTFKNYPQSRKIIIPFLL